MPRLTSNDIEQEKLARFDRIKKAIVALEKQQKQILKQGELAPLTLLHLNQWNIVVQLDNIRS